LTDAQMAEFTTKVGDVIGNATVIAIETKNAGHHPKTHEHLTQVILRLQG